MAQKQLDNDSLPLLERRVSHLETALKLMDVDLQDAINGFYRRRQADRMREVREDESTTKRKTRMSDKDLLMRALELSGSNKKDTTDNEE